MTPYCPALHILRGTMGADQHGHPILPRHRWIDGRCGHCGIARAAR